MVQPKSESLRTRGTNCVNPSLRTREGVRDILAQALRQEKRGNFFLPSSFVLLRPSVTLMMPTYIGRAICFPEPTNSNAKLIQKYPGMMFNLDTQRPIDT